MAWNYLALEAAIVARLKDQVPEFEGRVLTATDAVAEAKKAAHTPAAVVGLQTDSPETAPAGMSPEQRAEFARNQPTAQRYGVVLTVGNARTLATGAAAREEAGPLIAAVLLALSGWTPDARFWWPLVRVPAAPVRYGPGRLIYPLSFETRIVVTAAKLST